MGETKNTRLCICIHSIHSIVFWKLVVKKAEWMFTE